MTGNGDADPTVLSSKETWDDVIGPPDEATRCDYCGQWICNVECQTREVLDPRLPRL